MRVTARCPAANGFTVVELLVVVAIVALLIAALLPALQHARGEAMKVRCMGNVRLHALAITGYTMDDAERKPPHSSRWVADWGVRLTPYMVSNVPPVPLSGANGNAWYVQDVIPGMRCPDKPTGAALGNYTNGTYGMNRHITQINDDGTEGLYRKSLEMLRLDPSKHYLMGDAIVHNPIPWQDMGSLDDPANGTRRYRAHNRAVTMMFADLHVESLRRGQKTDLRGADVPASGGLLGFR